MNKLLAVDPHDASVIDEQFQRNSESHHIILVTRENAQRITAVRNLNRDMARLSQGFYNALADTDTAASALQRHFDWIHSILIRCFGHHRHLHFQ